MQIYLRLALTAIIPGIISFILYGIINKKYPVGKFPIFVLIWIGIFYGILSALASEFGIKIDIAVINARDVPPLCAGLIFGAPAGIIAGLIGGIERYLSPWSADYTRVACTTATILSGFVSGLLRIVIFDDKRPSWVFGVVTAAVIEVCHMLMIFATHGADITNAFTVVQACAIPMISVTALGVGVALLSLDIYERTAFIKQEKETIAQSLQKKFILCMVVVFAFTGLYTYYLQNRISYEKSFATIKTNISDIKNQIEVSSENEFFKTANNIIYQLKKIQSVKEFTTADFIELANQYDVSEINTVNEKGIITCSNIADYIGYDMGSNESTKEFEILIKNNSVSKYSQPMRQDLLNPKKQNKYVGVKFDSGYVQIGFSDIQYHKALDEIVANSTNNWHIGQFGYAIIADRNNKIVSNPKGYVNYRLTVMNINPISIESEDYAKYEWVVGGEDSYVMSCLVEGYTVLGILPKSEVLRDRDVTLYTSMFMEAIIFFIIFMFIYYTARLVVINNLQKVNESLWKISEGNLDTVVNVRTNREFAYLSDDINKTVDTLKGYIAKEAARIDSDLKFAYQIQKSVLPTVHPTFTGHEEFDLFAGTKPAKQVGGDFYDFFFGDSKTLIVVIADVSGKGIPAAMFMMNAKTTIKNLAMAGMPIAEVMMEANKTLAEENDAGMFVTVWMARIDLTTGEMRFASAGHNPAIVVRDGKNPEMLNIKPNLVLAAINSAKYEEHVSKLNPGDVLYLYTDGVTEATDSKKELFGDDRLMNSLKQIDGLNCEGVCKKILADVDKFVGDAEQFDDITMLSFKLNNLLK